MNELKQFEVKCTECVAAVIAYDQPIRSTAIENSQMEESVSLSERTLVRADCRDSKFDAVPYGGLRPFYIALIQY